MRVGRSTPGRAAVARRLFAGVPTTYDRMSRLLSFGRDPHWRRFLVSRLSVEPGATVLDVATGTAAVALEAVRQKGARVVGLDLSEPMLREGLRRIAGSGRATSVRCVLGRAERLPFGEGTFDALTFTYLLRYVDDPAATLAELGRVVKPGGTVASLEFNVPQPPWEPLWWLYTRGVMPVIGQ